MMRSALLSITLLLTAKIALCQTPLISSFSPEAGPIGTQVMITGNNFSVTPAENTVYFGAVKAKVLTANTTALTVEVPTGATFEPISITVNRLTAKSARPFIVTTAFGVTDFTTSSFDATLNLKGGMTIISGDVDGDGKTDLMYIDYQADRINILRNTIQGNTISFAATSIALMYCGDVKMADMDGDGLMDLVVTSTGFSTMNVFKNKSTPGNISFENAISFPAGSSTWKLAIEDIDNDGKPDVVAANTSNNVISVFRNTSVNGVISLSSKVDFATIENPTRICIGDLDGDGKRDIAVTGSDYCVSIHKNTSVPGTVSLDNRVNLATQSFTYDVKMADLDGDGKLDLAVSNGVVKVSIFRNTSSPNSLIFDARMDLPAYVTPTGIGVNDLDGDGKPEIVAANSSTNGKAGVYKNNSAPGTISFAPYVNFNIGSDAGTVILADMNSDGLTDIITGNWTNSNFSYLQNRLNNAPSLFNCTELLTPTQNSVNVNYGMPVVFSWRKINNATSYTFKLVRSNGSISNIGPITDTFYSYSPAAAVGNYTWSIAPDNIMFTTPCLENSSFTTCLAATNPYTISATGNTSFCTTDSVKLKAPGAMNIQWFLNQQPIPGAVADTLWAKASGVYSVRVVNGSCYSDASNTITVTALSTPTKPILSKSGITDICPAGSVTLSTSTTSNSNQWYKDDAPISAATKYYYDATSAGRYFVKVVNTSTGCYVHSDTVTVNVFPAPPQPTISVTGFVNICNGDSLTLQSSAAGNNQWRKNGLDIPGAANAVYQAKENGSYQVKVTLNGCPSYSSTVTVNLKALPATPVISSTGNTTFCNGDSVKLQSSALIGNQWYKNNVAIAAANDIEYITKDLGQYTVKTTQNGCTSLSSSNTNITVLPLPVKPVIISVAAGLSTSTGYSSYQWYFNNTIITGATFSQYNTTENGIYRVSVTDNNNCKNSSDNFNYVTTALSDVELQGYTIQWFPNPVQNELTIKISSGTSLVKPVSIQVVDAMGKLVIKEQGLKNGLNTLFLQQLPAGVYFLTLKSRDSKKVVKVYKAG